MPKKKKDEKKASEKPDPDHSKITKGITTSSAIDSIMKAQADPFDIKTTSEAWSVLNPDNSDW